MSYTEPTQLREGDVFVLDGRSEKFEMIEPENRHGLKGILSKNLETGNEEWFGGSVAYGPSIVLLERN